jgi:hypothetical protein
MSRLWVDSFDYKRSFPSFVKKKKIDGSTPLNDVSKSLASVSSANTGVASQACASSDFDEVDSDFRRQQ